jgi:hypothetical protein
VGHPINTNIYQDMNNVSLQDVKELESKLNKELTEEQRFSVLSEYNRVVMDKAESWEEILEELIKK